MAHLMIFATMIKYYRVVLYDKIDQLDFGIRYDEVKTKMEKLKQIWDFFKITFLKGY